MENLIEDIKEKVNASIEISFLNLQNLKNESYKNKWTKEYEHDIIETKEKIISVNGQYIINQFKLYKVEQSPSPLYLLIVEEVNRRFDHFINIERSLRHVQSYF